MVDGYPRVHPRGLRAVRAGRLGPGGLAVRVLVLISGAAGLFLPRCEYALDGDDRRRDRLEPLPSHGTVQLRRTSTLEGELPITEGACLRWCAVAGCSHADVLRLCVGADSASAGGRERPRARDLAG